MAELTRAQASEKMQNIVEGSEFGENVSLKFGVLIGLIKVESVSNKEVVNTILHLVSTEPDPIGYLHNFCGRDEALQQQKLKV